MSSYANIPFRVPGRKQGAAVTALAVLFVSLAAPPARAATFAASQAFNVDAQQVAIAAADLDLDGDVDLVVLNSNPDDGVTVLENDGLGNFTASPMIPTGRPQGIVTGDLDGDGDPDVAIGLLVADAVLILRNDGGALVPVDPSIPAGDAPTSIDAADLDGDGDLDLAIANRQSEDVTVLRNDGGMSFALSGSIPTERDQSDIVAGDFDGDGLPDLAVTLQSDHQVMVLINDPPGAAPPGSFTAVDPPVTVNGFETFAIDAGDLDGDGDIDLVTASFETPDVDVLLNDGTGSFVVAQTVSALQQFDVLLADLDRDGDLDVATTARQDNVILVYTNDGTGTLGPAEAFPTAENAPFQLVAADLDGDGDQDLAVAHSFLAENMSVLINTAAPPAPGAPEAASADLPPGGTISTGSDATVDDPVETTVVTPVGGTVSIEETVGPTADPAGITILDTTVEITVTGGPAAPEDPYVLIFRIHQSLVPEGTDPATIRPMRDGVEVPLCTTAGVADPSSCLDGVPVLVGDDIVLRVLTVQASTWQFFVDAAPPVLSGRLTVTVVGGDSDFSLDGPFDADFSLDPGESVSFEDIPAGVYILTMTGVDAGLVVDAITCGPATLSVDLTAGRVTFQIGDDDTVTCRFTISGDDSGYNDSPGDPGFEFDTPFDDAGQAGDPTPSPSAAEATGDVAATSGVAGPAGKSQPDPPAASKDTATPPAAGPHRLDELPRTGLHAPPLGLAAGLLLAGQALSAMARRRRS